MPEKLTDETMQRSTVLAPPSWWERLRVAAGRRGQAELIRTAVNEYLDRQEGANSPIPR
jgi:hypothetical protein